MAVKIVVTKTCDLCGKEGETRVITSPVKKFEFGEGTNPIPYITTMDLDFCDACLDKATVIHTVTEAGFTGVQFMKGV